VSGLRYSEWKFWSVILGAKAVRLSVADALNREYFVIWPYAPADDRRPWRERRTEALEIIAEAIEMGLQPGEVRVA